jgi:hypothetical protein
MNISEVLKRIINVIYYPWLFLGISWLLWALFSFGLKFEITFDAKYVIYIPKNKFNRIIINPLYIRAIEKSKMCWVEAIAYIKRKKSNIKTEKLFI